MDIHAGCIEFRKPGCAKDEDLWRRALRLKDLRSIEDSGTKRAVCDEVSLRGLCVIFEDLLEIKGLNETNIMLR